MPCKCGFVFFTLQNDETERHESFLLESDNDIRELYWEDTDVDSVSTDGCGKWLFEVHFDEDRILCFSDNNLKSFKKVAIYDHDGDGDIDIEGTAVNYRGRWLVYGSNILLEDPEGNPLGDRSMIWYSDTPGVTASWKPVKFNFDILNYDVNSVCYRPRDGIWCAVAERGVSNSESLSLISKDNGITWTKGTVVPNVAELVTVRCNAYRFVAIGHNEENENTKGFYYSDDGLKWNASGLKLVGNSNSDNVALAYSGITKCATPVFVAGADDGGTLGDEKSGIYYSYNGIDWFRSKIDFTLTNDQSIDEVSVTWDGKRFVALVDINEDDEGHQYLYLLESKDGKEFKTVKMFYNYTVAQQNEDALCSSILLNPSVIY